MRWVRPQFAPQTPSGSAGGSGAPSDRAHRLNLLLSYAGWDDDSWVDRLPRLLSPMGVQALRAASGKEAATVIQSSPVHIAVVDLGLPLDGRPSGGAGAGPAGGVRLLELLRRLDAPPPTVVVKRPTSARDDERLIACALRAGAFAVIERPRDSRGLELMLDVLRRVLQRHYENRWPQSGPSEPPSGASGAA